MSTAFLLGLRNLRRNLRRSLVTGASILIGFAAVALFAGYTDSAYKGLAAQAIHGELLGHLTISRRGLATEGRLHPEKTLLREDEIARIRALVREQLPEAHVAPRLAINGMISNGTVSTIFVAEGITPRSMEVLRGPRARASGALSNEERSGITIARGLAQMLGLKDGDYAALLLSTVHGQANAADAAIIDTFSTGNAGTEDKFVYMPLAFAQSLFDVPGQADRLTLMLPDATRTEAARARLQAGLDTLGLDLEVRTWQELSAFYTQVKSMFDMIFGFLLLIVLVIVVMSVANAMSMSVIERTREIGTFRAMGMRDARVIRLFVTEALLLVAFGCLAGLLLTLALQAGLNAAALSYRPPNSTYAVPLHIGFDLPKVLVAAILLCALGVLSAAVPARHATSRKITDALAHV